MLRITEDEGKGALIHHLSQFISWPAVSLGPQTRPFLMCTLKASRVASDLQTLAQSKQISGHPIEVQEINSPAQAQKCQVFYIGHVSESDGDRYLESVRDREVLTVGDQPGFCLRGGIICLVSDADRVRFEINTHAMERAHLSASSRLLQLANRTEETPQAGAAN